MTELELVNGCLRGDNSSRRQLYELYSQRMMGICYRYTGNKTASQDLLHDGFLKVFESINSFQYFGDGSFLAWITRIFVNTTFDFLRKNGKWDAQISLEDWQESAVILEENDFEPVSDEILVRFISELPVGYRTVFNLYIFEEMSHKEIARMMGINESSSRSQLSRAKAILSGKIKKYALRYE